MTPAWSQAGAEPGGGGLGKRSRRHTPGSGTPAARARGPVQNTQTWAA